MSTTQVPTKSQASKNARTHGLYATEVVLPWEDADEFRKLNEDLQDEYSPDGRSEVEALEDMAIWLWKKRRLNRISQIAFHMQKEAKAITEAANKNGLQGVADYLSTCPNDGMADVVCAAAKSQSQGFKQICDKINEHTARICKPDDATTESKQSDVDKLEKLAALSKELNLAGNELIKWVCSLEGYLEQNLAAKVYRPDIMEKELKLHAGVDRQIEKAMVRLVKAREIKKTYRVKTIDVTQNGITSAATLPRQN
jgi:hypothetical protein